jgi:colicin import membrane protein
MPRKLKVYQTSQGFFDLVIAAPSMKAALEAWGTSANLFHSGFAWETDDRKVTAAAKAKPGVVLKRPVGTSEPFQEHSHLPASLPAAGSPKALATLRHPRGSSKNCRRNTKKAASRNESVADEAAAREAALAYEKEEGRRRKQRQKVEAIAVKKRNRRKTAEAKAKAALHEARKAHEAVAKRIDKERKTVEQRADGENARWKRVRDRLERAAGKART